MIKIDKQNFKIETNCKTVGEFMTSAAAFGCDRLKIKVDGCLYEFFDNPKIRVSDDTPIGLVFIDGIGSGGTTPDVVHITVITKPKPKIVRKSGWVNIWRSETDGLTYCGENIYEDKSLAERVGKDCGNNIATVRVEWEEVEQ